MAKRPPTLGFNPHRRQGYERQRREAKPWRSWYSLAAWRERRDAQLRKQPLCERHLARGEVVEASVANHKVPHRGNWRLFIEGELESTCKPCHDSEVQREERAAARAVLRSREV
jgi:5-methylcytosine-specific restriction endonuclease McrA